MIILAVDPGRSKCGVAVVGSDSGILVRAVVPRQAVGGTITGFVETFSPSIILVGEGTGGRDVQVTLDSLNTGRPVVTVEERFTSLSARSRFFVENPPRGLRRLIPLSLQVPPIPYDDYVAVILAERYIAEHRNL